MLIQSSCCRISGRWPDETPNWTATRNSTEDRPFDAADSFVVHPQTLQSPSHDHSEPTSFFYSTNAAAPCQPAGEWGQYDSNRRSAYFLSASPLSLIFALSARSPSAPRSSRPAFIDAYFRYRKFNEGKPRFDIDGAERDAALWYTNFHDITLDQLRQANDHWYPQNQELVPQAPSQPPMQLHTPSPSSPSPSPEASAVYSHIKPEPFEAEDQEIDHNVDEEHVQDTRLLAFLGPVMLNQEYHLPPSASIQELLSYLHSDTIASFMHEL